MGYTYTPSGATTALAVSASSATFTGTVINGKVNAGATAGNLLLLATGGNGVNNNVFQVGAAGVDQLGN